MLQTCGEGACCPKRGHRSAGCAAWWLFWCGTCGAHHHYLGRHAQGFVWGMTGGLCCAGTLVDSFLIQWYAQEANAVPTGDSSDDPRPAAVRLPMQMTLLRFLMAVSLISSAGAFGSSVWLDYTPSRLDHASAPLVAMAGFAYLLFSFGDSRTSFPAALAGAAAGLAAGGVSEPASMHQLQPRGSQGLLAGALLAACCAACFRRRTPRPDAEPSLPLPDSGAAACAAVVAVKLALAVAAVVVTTQHSVVPVELRRSSPEWASPACDEALRARDARLGDIVSACAWDGIGALRAGSKEDQCLAELGLGPDPTRQQVRAAFLRRSKETHPDKAPDREDEFLRVLDAYQCLGHRTSRGRRASEL